MLDEQITSNFMQLLALEYFSQVFYINRLNSPLSSVRIGTRKQKSKMPAL